MYETVRVSTIFMGPSCTCFGARKCRGHQVLQQEPWPGFVLLSVDRGEVSKPTTRSQNSNRMASSRHGSPMSFLVRKVYS